MAHEYDFLTTWCVDAPIDDVWEVIKDSAAYPEWWKGVRRVEELEPGDEDGVGTLNRLSWRSVLPYTLTFEMRAVRVEPPHLLVGHAAGELAGVGTWRLYEGQGTAIVYRWQVHSTKRWMNALGPLARPAFAWNHDLVMRQGGVGLARRVGGALLASD